MLGMHIVVELALLAASTGIVLKLMFPSSFGMLLASAGVVLAIGGRLIWIVVRVPSWNQRVNYIPHMLDVLANDTQKKENEAVDKQKQEAKVLV
jgi:hypothetical protein